MADKRDITIKKRHRFSKLLKTDQRTETHAETSADMPAETGRRKARKRRGGRSAVGVLLKRLLVLCVAIAIGIAAWVNWDNLAPSYFYDWLDDTFHGGVKGAGFPVPISGNKVISMSPVSNCLAVLTDTSLMLINHSGGEAAQRSHTFTRPVLETAGQYALLAELGGMRFQLETKRKTVYSLRAESDIVAASVSDKGYVGLITRSNRGYVSDIVVYNPEGKLIFRRSSGEVLADIAVRSDGQQVAVISVGAENGAMVSSLQVFSTREKQEQPTAFYTGREVMLMAVRYLSSHQVAAVGDTESWLMDIPSNTCKTRSYGGQQLLGYAISSEGILTAVRPKGTSSGGQLLLLDAETNGRPAVAFEGAYRDIHATEHAFWLLTENGLHTLTQDGLKQQGDWAAGGLMVSSLRDKPVVLRLSELAMED